MDINLYSGWISTYTSDPQIQKSEASPHGRRTTQGVVRQMLGQSYIDLGGVLQTVHQNKIEHGEMTEQIQMPRREFKEPKLTFKDANRRTARSFFFILSLLAATFICKAIE